MAAFAGLVASQPVTAQDFYQGKKLTMIVGFGAGGGIDTVARMLVRALEKHIPGSPAIVVQNMPGAAGITALNTLYRTAPTDGTTIAFDNWSPLAVVAKDKSVQFDYGKLSLLGAIGTGPYVMFARKDAVEGGLAQPADIVKAKGLVYAGQQPALVLDVHGRLGMNLMMKGNYKYVSGYRSAPEIRLAMERGEAGVTTHGLQGYRSGIEPRYVKDGLFVPLWYFQRRDATGKLFDDPDARGLPTFLSAYRAAYGGDPSGPDWDALRFASEVYGVAGNFIWGPPGMHEKAAEILRQAFAKAFVDPGFLAEQDKTFRFRHPPVPIEEARKVVAKLAAVDESMTRFFQTLMMR